MIDQLADGRNAVSEMVVHPFNLEIYGEPDEGLKESLGSFGLQHPIKITPDRKIISGARRWTAAKALGWDLIDIEIPDLDFDDEAAIQKYTLLANAYRKSKPTYTQKREADAYLDLLENGHVTKKELRALASQRVSAMGPHGAHGAQAAVSEPITKAEDERKPTSLAARAAGISKNTYKRFRYVDNPDGAEKDIKWAADAEEIETAVAEDLQQALGADRDKLRRSEITPVSAESRTRKRMREAKEKHSMTEAEARESWARERVLAVMKKGNGYIAALSDLVDDHGQALDGGMALTIARQLFEIRGILNGLFVSRPEIEPTEDELMLEGKHEIVA